MRIKEVLFVGFAIAFAATACDDSNSGGSCTQGTANCACLNGTCNAGLQCSNNVCVASTQGAGGNSSTTSSGQGGTTATGNGGTTAVGNGGSVTATGGAATCSNTTSDPNNCGTCGHVCSSGTCNNGVCSPGFTDCFTKSQYTTCNAACQAVGRSCVAAGCVGDTFRGWISSATCTARSASASAGPLACDAAIDWTGMSYARCCCN